ncbi:hypothetical protein AAVH_15214 [Aphelenchoides avenae]|nr:hypothetical protein AAVH_15214 [Aphelenchus avenae]
MRAACRLLDLAVVAALHCLFLSAVRARFTAYQQRMLPAYRRALLNQNFALFTPIRRPPSSSHMDGNEASTSEPDLEEESDCSLYPNQTLFQPHFYSCASTAHPPIFVLHDTALANTTGDYSYPLDFSQTLRVFFDLTSFASRRYDNMRAEVALYRRRTGWLGCGWMFLPTFGLIDNFDVCEDNLSCPVYPGRQVLEVAINPNIIFSGILKMIHSDRVPYKLVVRLINNRKSEEELLCAAFQARIQF